MPVETRTTSRLPYSVSAVGLGTWQLGGDWGEVAADAATEILQVSVDSGVSLFDTADVYGDGRSEQAIGRFTASGARATVFTKLGRRAEQRRANYTLDNFRQWTDRSRANLGVDTLDLVQLHCPPTDVITSDDVFDGLDTLVAEQRIAAYGVSVETCAQALLAIARPGVSSVQIVLNAFRQKPLEEVLPAAAEAGVAIIARVPLASGLLSGRFDRGTTFAETDHRHYNRSGQAFDVGETFAGVPYQDGVDAAARFAALAEGLSITPAQLALRWILDQPGVTTVIPGASTPAQARSNAIAAELARLSDDTLAAITDLYDESIRSLVHDRW